ncbi:MAG: hypothetical protein EOO96_04720, partial [Pedobacter sp.]
MKRNCLLIFILSIIFINCDAQTTSKHSVVQYRNNNKATYADVNIYILIDSIKITAKKEGFFYFLPLIDTSKTINLVVEINKKEFISTRHKAWWINGGSRIDFGKITKINKLLSVAKYNDMDKSEGNWDIFSKRFFIADGGTIDIQNPTTVKELNFLRISPN